MNVRRGDVVLVGFPFASGSGSKRRPALVVQNDRNNQRMRNTILAAITTTVHRSSESTQFLVDPSTSDGQASGLYLPSVVSCENLATVEHALITRILGRLQPSMMQQIDACLKAALDLQ
ncbi:MAG: type II toxin-antitoxin system PemK/MazF family toxin [Planctomycetia bacterium]|nr:type II toxin-antitoxin system PemK/MazF family toxin [Planctomycetia bacterium]